MKKNSVIRQISGNLSYVLFSQCAVFILGIAKSILLPKFWSVEAFGYWQLYLFYCAYAGVFAFGFNDGIYLRYGKYAYEELPQKRLRTALRLFTICLILCSIFMALIVLGNSDAERRFVFWAVCMNIVLVCLNGVLSFIMQVTNQLKKYSIFSMADKIFLLLTILVVIFLNEQNYKVIIVADIFIKSVVLIAMIWTCRLLFWGDSCSLGSAWRELQADIRIGIKLMIANLMGMLILGIGRILVEWFGDIQEYAFYSFGISATNLIFIFITAVSMVIYPALKRLPDAHYGNYYNKLNTGLSLFNFGILLVYFPVCWLIALYLPRYMPVLAYLNFLFGLIVMQSKIALLNNTFYKTLRLEKEMLKANLSCVILFLVCGPLLFLTTGKIASIAMSSFLVMGVRCYASEYFLRRKMNVSKGAQYGREFIMFSAFIIPTVLWGNNWGSVVLYFIALTGYLIYSRKTIKEITLTIRNAYL